MDREIYTVIALPHSFRDDDDFHVSLFVAPRLTPTQDGEPLQRVPRVQQLDRPAPRRPHRALRRPGPGRVPARPRRAGAGALEAALRPAYAGHRPAGAGVAGARVAQLRHPQRADRRQAQPPRDDALLAHRATPTERPPAGPSDAGDRVEVLAGRPDRALPPPRVRRVAGHPRLRRADRRQEPASSGPTVPAASPTYAGPVVSSSGWRSSCTGRGASTSDRSPRASTRRSPPRSTSRCRTTSRSSTSGSPPAATTRR